MGSDAVSLAPRPPCPAFVACSVKSGGKAWKDLSRDVCRCWRHVLQLATINPVAIGLTEQTEQKERTEFWERIV